VLSTRQIFGLVVLNAMLASAIQISAPDQPINDDRESYEYVGEHGFAPNCPHSIYCYRVLVPLVLQQIPFEPETRWRGHQVLAAAAAGTIIALVTHLVAGGRAALIASVLAQTNYGFSFTAYDPYTADPMVFVCAAMIAWCWVTDRWRLALIVGLVGIFIKETVALVSATCLLAALPRDRRSWRAWVTSAFTVAFALLAFRWTMETFYGWDISTNPAAQFARGSWLVRWWHNNPFLVRKLYLLFAPFGFAWLFAVLGFQSADWRLRRLAAGAILPFLALCYVQTPERALANAFFVVVPLAAAWLARAPRWLAISTAVANGAATAKVGSSTSWLPPSGYLMIPALLLAMATIWSVVRESRVASARTSEAR
jgi:hypothetical protein